MPDTLNAGESLTVGQELRSNNGKFNLVMQQDGNLVLYDGSAAPWATGTWNLPPDRRPQVATMTNDGDLVLYGPGGNPIWSLGTGGHNGARLVLKDDRNLVVYDPANNVANNYIWASNTALPAETQPIQASKTDNVGFQKQITTNATLYLNGLLVLDIYTQNDSLWAGLHGHVLVVIKDGAGRAIWVSQDHACITRCSVPDFSCPSRGRETQQEKFPDVAGKYAQGLDIYQADGANFIDLRNHTIDVIKQLVDVADELKNAWNQLTKT